MTACSHQTKGTVKGPSVGLQEAYRPSVLRGISRVLLDPIGICLLIRES